MLVLHSALSHFIETLIGISDHYLNFILCLENIDTPPKPSHHVRASTNSVRVVRTRRYRHRQLRTLKASGVVRTLRKTLKKKKILV